MNPTAKKIGGQPYTAGGSYLFGAAHSGR